MTLPNPLRITRAFISRISGVNSRTRAASSPSQSTPSGVPIKPSLDLKIDTKRIITNVFKENVTVVIPTLNEAGAISEVIEEVKAEGYHNILVVDGYSTDRTDRIASGNGAKLVYQHGIGKGGGVKTALESVKTPYVLFMDGDGSYDPKDIWRLLNHADNHAQVIGVRDRKHIPQLHRFGNWIISELFSLLFGVKVTDVCSGMYLLDVSKAGGHNLEEPGFVAEIELAAQTASMQELTEVPINYRQRIGTRKLRTWSDGRAILSAAFKLALRHNPVFLYSGLATLSVIPAGSILLWILWEWLARRVWHSGWALLGSILLFVAAQAFTLMSVSLLTKHAERRLLREIRNHTRTTLSQSGNTDLSPDDVP
jgi:glycosyltransferase involved in cell wall biosynthesis